MLNRPILLIALLATVGLWSCAESESSAYEFPEEPAVEEPQEPEEPIEEPEEPEEPVEEPPPVDQGPKNPRPPISTVDCLQGTNLTYWHPEVLRQYDGRRSYVTKRCTPDGVIAIIPRGTTWEISAHNLKPGDQLRVYTPHYFTDEHLGELREPEAVSPEPTADGQTSFRYTGVHGGEHVLIIDTADTEAIQSVLINATCVENCDRVTTRFPLVMVHGFLGTNSYFGILDYWSGIISPLRKLGGEVFTPSSSMVDSSASRAVKIAEQIDDAIALTGARKVNLIGHSQGGLDARIIASPGGLNRSSNISSITTIATPHRGVPIPLLDLLSDFVNVIFTFPNFSEAEAKRFNQKYTDASMTTYYSWAFRTCDSVDYLCQIRSGGEKVNSLLEYFYRAIAIATLGDDNDGLVTVKSARWGHRAHQFGPLWADHMDQIGQIARLPSAENFNHVTFYQDWAHELILRGH